MGTLPGESMNTDKHTLKQGLDLNKQYPEFYEPWEAHAFAIAVKLSEKGLLKWSEWSDLLAVEIKKAKEEGNPDFGNTFYQFWLSALETILIENNILDNCDIKLKTEQWRKAFQSTPHGNPVKLVKYK